MQADTSQLIDLSYIVALAHKALSLQTPHDHQPFVFKPEGLEVFTPLRNDQVPLPDHIRQNVTLDDLDSFIAYVAAFKTTTAQIFASVSDTGAEFNAVLDYHSSTDLKAGRLKHAADYETGYSTDYEAWSAISNQQLAQNAFLDFIRKWGNTITSMDQADMIELASSLDFSVKGDFSSHVERTTGGRKLLFDEQVEGSATVKQKKIVVPDKLKMNMPIFDGGQSYDLEADIMYRPQNGNLRIIIELVRPHLVIRQAVKDVLAKIQAGTGITPFVGSLQ